MLLDFISAPLFDDAGRVAGIFIEGFDVTSHVETANALCNSEKELRELNEHLEGEVLERSTVGGAYWQTSSELLGLIGAGGRYKKNNPAWQRVLGWSNAELRGESYLKVIHTRPRRWPPPPARRI